MVSYTKEQLSNGLTVIIHQDDSSPLVAVNILYKVGSKDELPDKTGFTHLFEHLMFGGTANIPQFDDVIQNAGGENNAFTNNDFTNFYDILPADNIEVALWLEADRMRSPLFTKKGVETQKKVVIEEFKETCLNEPYGDMWHHLSEMCYSNHSYRWPTIGKEMQHIADANLGEVSQFFYNYYRPNNAILVIAGNISPQEGMRLVKKWFGDIPSGDTVRPNYDRDSRLLANRKELYQDVPLPTVIMAFPMADRLDKEFYTADLLSDILASGRSSRLYQSIVRSKQASNMVDAYISGTTDPGLLIVEGKPSDGHTLEEVESLLWQELQRLQDEPLDERELQKIKNKAESNLIFSETSILNKAMSLAYYEYLGNIQLINDEVEIYRSITAKDLQQAAQYIFDKSYCQTLVYYPKP